ncbi:hypothetical protein MHT86_07265 [Corynebacterium mastitidis]|uniref:Uncharacterized protein n=1 Tax=Corynebacterium mastitidis TaxID=161890 RepID=A0A2N0X984_9CORY|nr:hypothetical protein [Corynebacterium mastitidis]MCH6197290.1 hypothetical protein [Corynebacterium mastitidis]PKF69227.1 hypothetical protein CXB45_02615 [Corynebacterium mastitidis]
MIAVVDERPDATVVWHVQTTVGDTAVMSGAWIVEDPADLLVGAVRVEPGAEVVEDLARAISAERDRVREACEGAVKGLRLDPLVVPDLGVLASAYQGEPIAQRAWVTATALAQLVQQWHTLETQRRSRKHLQEVFGREIRPLPLRNHAEA